MITVVSAGDFSMVSAKSSVIEPPQHVILRKYPSPFIAMLAIDSDADHVDLRKFNEVHRFLNTYDKTSMGNGLGLDIADSFFLYNGSNLSGNIDAHHVTVANEMTMFQGTTNTPSPYAPILLHYIRHGWIDTFHSAGDFSRINKFHTLFTRSLEQRALAWMKNKNIPTILVFSDHGNMSNVANFGAYKYGGVAFSQAGDNPRSFYYIADLLHQEGVRFVWNSGLNNTFSNASMLFPIYLRDGTWVWGYHRYTGNTYTDIGALWNPYQLPQELSHTHLNKLIKTQGFTVITTHLEGNADHQPLSNSAIAALIHLAQLQNQGQILVTRTSRLLWYNLVHQGLVYRVLGGVGIHYPITYINVLRVNDSVHGNFVPTWQELRGITWVIPHPEQAVILIAGKQVTNDVLVRTKKTIGIAWYPANTTDWTVSLGSKAYQQLKAGQGNF